MTQLVLGIVGIVVILIVSSILRGLITHKTGYRRTGRSEVMGAVEETARQAFRAGDLRKEIYAKRDSFRGTQVIEAALSKLFDDPAHLPAKITMSEEGIFIIPWEDSTGKYAMQYVQKLGFGDLPSYDYLNGCAVFLLIQERYPGQYDFPNTKVNDYDSGEVTSISLLLKSAGKIVTW